MTKGEVKQMREEAADCCSIKKRRKKKGIPRLAKGVCLASSASPHQPGWPRLTLNPDALAFTTSEFSSALRLHPLQPRLSQRTKSGVNVLFFYLK